MADHIIRADEITAGTEFIIHSSSAGEFVDHYVTATADADLSGLGAYIDVIDRTGRTGTLHVGREVACTIYHTTR